jgi:hypothetical protein
MEKRHIIRFLKEGKRGAYTLLVKMYADEVLSMGTSLALEIIKEDLQQQAGEQVNLNYTSLAHAIARFKKTNKEDRSNGQPRKWVFKDAHETPDRQLAPGRFKLE